MKGLPRMATTQPDALKEAWCGWAPQEDARAWLRALTSRPRLWCSPAPSTAQPLHAQQRVCRVKSFSSRHGPAPARCNPSDPSQGSWLQAMGEARKG